MHAHKIVQARYLKLYVRFADFSNESQVQWLNRSITTP